MLGVVGDRRGIYGRCYCLMVELLGSNTVCEAMSYRESMISFGFVDVDGSFLVDGVGQD